MIYRELGKTGKKLSLLSFGGMRLPRVNVGASVKVIHRAIDYGINFFETAPGYGDSEHKIGVALRTIERNKIYLSTKSHPGKDFTASDLRKRLDDSLKKLETDYIDFYQIWGINTEEHFQTTFKNNGLLEGIRSAQKEGLIHHLGFTSHASPDMIIKIMKTKEFESATIIYHLYHDKNKIVLDHAEKLNMGVIAIAPLANGLLAHPTEKMNQDFAPYDVRDYSLKWLANDSRITTICSGMKTFKELDNNYLSLKQFSYFSDHQKNIEIQIKKRIKEELGNDFCKECAECLPCPENINIPELLRINHFWQAYQAEYYCKDRYKFMGNGGSWYPGSKAHHCTDCGDCEPRCPENIQIVRIIKNLHKDLFTGDRNPLSNH